MSRFKRDLYFIGDLNKYHSTKEYRFTVAIGPVCQRSILQSTIALSTTEVDYMVVTETIKGGNFTSCID